MSTSSPTLTKQAPDSDAASRERELAETLRARRMRAPGGDEAGAAPGSERDRSPRTVHSHGPDYELDRERERDYEQYASRRERSVRDRERQRERERERDWAERHDTRERDRGWPRRSEERDRRSRRSPRHSPRRSPIPASRGPPAWRPLEKNLQEPDDETVDRTVFCASLSQLASSQMLGQFFANHLGRSNVIDAQIVADKVTRRPKGVGYVTLSTREYAQKAREMTGTYFYGIPIHVTSVPVAIPAAAAAAAVIEDLNHNVASTGGPGTDNPAARLYVGSLHFDLDAAALQPVFAAFGPVEYVDLHREASGKSKGFAFVQFTDPVHAQAARQHLQGVEIMGRPLRVRDVNPRPGVGGRPIAPSAPPIPSLGGPVGANSMEPTVPSYLDEGGGGRLDADARAALMRNLMYRGAVPGDSREKQISAAHTIPPPPPSTTIKLSNMFNPEQETEPNWPLEMAADVQQECSAQYGGVVKVWVDEQSQGDIYLRFVDSASAQRAIAALNGRFFNGRSIVAHAIPEAIFDAKVA